MKRLVLHVGLPKTASTSLQNWCYRNRGRLLERGILYPDRVVRPDDPRHQFLVTDLRNTTVDRTLPELLRSPEPLILLSSEGLAVRLFDFTDAAAARFRELTRDVTVDVIVIFRQADDWVSSMWKQFLLSPSPSGPNNPWRLSLGARARTEREMRGHIDDLLARRRPGEHLVPGLATFNELPRVRYFVDRARVVEDLYTVFGASHVVVGDLEDGWHNVLGSALGLSISGDEGAERYRESVPDDLAESIRSLIELQLPDLLRYRILGAAARGANDRDGLRMMLHQRRPHVLEVGATIGVSDDLERWIADNLAVDDFRWGVVEAVRRLVAQHR